MKSYTTNNEVVLDEKELQARSCASEPEMRLVKIYPHIQFQRIIGFGAALTEAAAVTFSRMDDARKKLFLKLCFSEEGNRYSLCRTTIQSCDFSLGPRAYLSERDRTLRSFTIDDDRTYIIPFLKAAIDVNPQMKFIASPWSPPAWAKTNRSMIQGGSLRMRDRKLWAKMIVRYLLEYRSEGIEITRITLQNEPNAAQPWESCVFNASEEARFACAVREELDKAGLERVRIFIWDHNKEGMFDRTSACLSNPHAASAIGGVAFHWYSGDHFPAVAATSLLIGDRELIFSEGCDSYSAGDPSQELPHAEHYAREAIGDLEAGTQGIVDWNILLDEQGGPNHVGNYCDAPIMYDTQSDELCVRLPFHYLGHFSRFIQPGAHRVLSSCYTTDLETCAFANPDGTFALVALNRNDWTIPINVAFDSGFVNEHTVHPADLPPHSITTITW